MTGVSAAATLSPAKVPAGHGIPLAGRDPGHPARSKNP